jgi:hypothetical protein
MYHLAWIMLSHTPTRARREVARELLTQAAALGDSGAELDLAVLSARGRFGLQRIPAGLRMIGPATDKMIAVSGAALSTTDTLPHDAMPGAAPTKA